MVSMENLTGFFDDLIRFLSIIFEQFLFVNSFIKTIKLLDNLYRRERYFRGKSFIYYALTMLRTNFSLANRCHVQYKRFETPPPSMEVL